MVDVVGLACELGAGVFVGGASWRWKIEALGKLRTLGAPWVHVGRASHLSQLQAAASDAGADSLDSLSFLRQQNHNRCKLREYRALLNEYACRRPTPIENEGRR